MPDFLIMSIIVLHCILKQLVKTPVLALLAQHLNELHVH